MRPDVPSSLQVSAAVVLLRIGSRGTATSLQQLVDGFPAESQWQRAAAPDLAPAPVTLTVDPGDDLLAAAAEILSPDEAARASQLRDPLTRTTYALAHACLRMWLARELSAPAKSLHFVPGPFGKPRLVHERPAMHFNLSRRPGLVAIAMGTAPLGVDVEAVRPDIDIAGIAARFFTAEEQRHVLADGSGAALRRFFVVWARKEALLKAAGLGVDHLNAAGALKSPVALVDDSGASRSYAVQSLESPADCSLAMAIEVPQAIPGMT